MGFSATIARRGKTHSAPGNHASDFSAQDSQSHRANGSAYQQPHRKNRPVTTQRVSGVHHYGYRYYDPVTGTWPSRDPIYEVGGINIYSFVGNDGVNYWDHNGNQRQQLPNQAPQDLVWRCECTVIDVYDCECPEGQKLECPPSLGYMSTATWSGTTRLGAANDAWDAADQENRDKATRHCNECNLVKDPLAIDRGPIHQIPFDDCECNLVPNVG